MIRYGDALAQLMHIKAEASVLPAPFRQTVGMVEASVLPAPFRQKVGMVEASVLPAPFRQKVGMVEASVLPAPFRQKVGMVEASVLPAPFRQKVGMVEASVVPAPFRQKGRYGRVVDSPHNPIIVHIRLVLYNISIIISLAQLFSFCSVALIGACAVNHGQRTQPITRVRLEPN